MTLKTIFLLFFFLVACGDSSSSAFEVITDCDTEENKSPSTPDNDTPSESGDSSDDYIDIDRIGPSIDEDEVASIDEDFPVERECTAISMDKFTSGQVYAAWYEGFFSPLLGDEKFQDVMSLQFEGEQKVGVYDLASNINSNFETCEQCVLIYQDYNEGNYVKAFFQESGGMELKEVKTYPSGEISMESHGILTNIKLVEVTIDDKNKFHSTVVPGGECIELSLGEWDTMCRPNCSDKICGDDGCGGTCGPGCGEDEECIDDGTACTLYQCEKISMDAVTRSTKDGTYISISPDFGEPKDNIRSDMIKIEFSGPKAPGTYDLTAGPNASYSTCEQCVVLHDNISAGGMFGISTFYPQKGIVELEIVETDSENSYTGKSKGELQGVRFIESTINKDDWTVSPVVGGKCYELESGKWNAEQIISPIKRRKQ